MDNENQVSKIASHEVDKTADRELWCAELDWLINSSGSALGQRGTLGSVISRLERGNSGGSSNDEPYSDQVLGFGSAWAGKNGDVERWRRVSRRYFALPPDMQVIIGVRYTPPRNPDPGVVGQLGRWASLAVHLTPAERVEGLLKACLTPKERDSSAVLKAALKRAEKACREAHRAYLDIKAKEAARWVG